MRLFEEAQAAGCPGSYNRVKIFVRAVRPRPLPEPVIRFEIEPGHQRLVDFAEFRLPWGKRFALLVVLAYSRLLWLRFYPRQDMRTLCNVTLVACHWLAEADSRDALCGTVVARTEDLPRSVVE